MQQQLATAQGVAAEGAGDTKGHLAVHTLRNSGHWVHVRPPPSPLPHPPLPAPPPDDLCAQKGMMV